MKLPIHQLTLSGCLNRTLIPSSNLQSILSDCGWADCGWADCGWADCGCGGHWNNICISDPKYWGGGGAHAPPVPTPMHIQLQIDSGYSGMSFIEGSNCKQRCPHFTVKNSNLATTY